VTQQLAQYGIQPGPRGSGVGDVEYWTDQVLDPVNTGYGDWAGRIQRGAQGTQPPLAGGGGAGGAGGAFGTGVNYDALRQVAGNVGGLSEAALQASPGYQFRLGEGLKALERSAAARGTLLTGGTLKGLNRYAQDVASNEYGNQYARQFGEQQARYNQLMGLGGLDLQTQGQRAGQLMGLAQLGYGAAGQQAGQGSIYAGQAGNILGGQAQSMGDLLTGQGNAQAAGTIGQGNAWQQGLGGVTNAAQQYYLYQLLSGGGGGGGQPQRQYEYWNQGNTGPVR
jgi:hypothetical protein